MRSSRASRDDRLVRALDGQIAMVTGASRGLGRATALAFARDGASLAICARGLPDLETVAGELALLGSPSLRVAVDLRSRRDVDRFVALTFDRFGRVDVLVNNASELGPTPLPHLADYPTASFEDVLRVNLVAPFVLTQAVIGDMLRRGRGVVVNISSDVAVSGYAGWGAYAVSKAGIDALARTWAAELEGTGVRIHSIDPGDMHTAMHTAALPDDDPASLLDPATVAPALVALAAGQVDAPNGARLRASELLAAAAAR